MVERERCRGRATLLADRGGEADGGGAEGAPVLPALSRRRFLTTLPGWSGLLDLATRVRASPGAPATQRRIQQSASGLALRLGAPGSVDLDSTAEQVIDIPHGSGARPATARVVLVDVIQDDPAIDTRPVQWADGYPVYDESGSTTALARVLVKFARPAGVAATGRARILFEP